MNDLVIKSVDVLGDAIMATKDEKGYIWAGVSYFCNALGMSKGQKDRQTANVQKDETLKRGCRKFEAGVFDLSNEAIGIRIDFVPLWLAKINITPSMLKDNPDLADKLLDYQLKAKDILAAAFLPQQQTTDDKIALLAQGHMEVSQRVDGLEKRFNEFQKSLPLLPNEADQVSNTLKKRVVEVLGGKTANAYKNRSLCQKVFMDAYRELKRNFNVTRYKDIKREQLGAALEVASSYTPPVFLAELIATENAQMKLDDQV